MKTNEYITIEEEITERNPVTKEAFSDFFNEKLERLNSAANKTNSDRPELKKRDIADMIGVSYEVFRKYINKEKPTERRDCIIAICAVLGATVSETNDGLYYYGMDELARGWKRDEAIMELIGNDEKPRTVDEINDGLIERGFDELDIIHHKGRQKTTDKAIKYPYTLKRKKVAIPEIDFINDELHFVSQIDMRYIQVRAFMEFSDNGNPITIWAEVTNSDLLSEFNSMFYVHDPRLPYWQRYTDLELTGEFMDSFAELQKTAITEIKKLNNFYNDTKNFKYLTSAKVIDNELHFFAEAYNNDLLLKDEYYLMDYCNDKLTMTVSSKSRFLRLFLTEEEYKQKFPNNSDDIIAVYAEDLDAIEDDDPSEKIMALRSDYYDELKDRIEEMMQLIFDEELAVCGARYPIDKNDIYSDLQLIETTNNKVIKAFDCIIDRFKADYLSTEKKASDPSELNSMDFAGLTNSPMLNGENISTGYYTKIVGVRNERPEFTLSGGEKVKLTVQDIIDGMNLGLKTIDDIGYFLLKNGTLDLKEIIYDLNNLYLDTHGYTPNYDYDDTTSELGYNAYELYIKMSKELKEFCAKINELRKQGASEEVLHENYNKFGNMVIAIDEFKEDVMEKLDPKGRKEFKEFVETYEKWA